MKRTLIATALVTTLGTSAFAATETQIEAIDSFSAGINTDLMTEEQLNIAYGIINSGDSRGEKLAKLRALEADTVNFNLANISDAEKRHLQQYAPNADLETVTKDQMLAALAVSYGNASESEKAERVQAVLNDYSVVDTMAQDITEGRERMIRAYAPNVDLSTLSEEDVQTIMSYIHSDMSRGETAGKIEAIINS